MHRCFLMAASFAAGVTVQLRYRPNTKLYPMHRRCHRCISGTCTFGVANNNFSSSVKSGINLYGCHRCCQLLAAVDSSSGSVPAGYLRGGAINCFFSYAIFVHLWLLFSSSVKVWRSIYGLGWASSVAFLTWFGFDWIG